MATDPAVNVPYVSTGNLPPAEHVRLLVNEAYERFRANAEGELSQVYPSLAAIDPDRFGICVANTRGLTADATAGSSTIPASATVGALADRLATRGCRLSNHAAVGSA